MSPRSSASRDLCNYLPLVAGLSRDFFEHDRPDERVVYNFAHIFSIFLITRPGFGESNICSRNSRELTEKLSRIYRGVREEYSGWIFLFLFLLFAIRHRDIVETARCWKASGSMGASFHPSLTAFFSNPFNLTSSRIDWRARIKYCSPFGLIVLFLSIPSDRLQIRWKYSAVKECSHKRNFIRYFICNLLSAHSLV